MTTVIDVIQEYGANSVEAKMASVIMAGSETTVYIITMLFAAGKISKGRGVLAAGLIADIVAVAGAIIFINLDMW